VKKIVFIVAVAAILMFAFAGTAMAAVNRSGQQFLGASPGPSVIPTQGVNTNVYMNWQSISTGPGTLGDNGNPANGVTPHGGYTTTTVKCVVCHSIHYAAPGNAPVANGAFNNGNQTADTLLRMRADQACAFCHATAGMAVNGKPVYDGLSPNPYTAVAGHVTGPNCSLCHTSVHGDPQDNSVASLAGFLLRTMPSNDPVGAYGPTVNMITAIDAIDSNAQGQGWFAGQALGDQTATFASVSTPTLREKAVGIFCAECHAGSYSQVAAGASANIQDWSQSSTNTALGGYSGHRIGASATSAWNSAGDVSSSSNWSESTQSNIGAVAWLPATECQSCHAADDVFNESAFPHSWGGSKMWLLTGADSSQANKITPFADPASFGAGGDPLQLQLQDGVCLRCHVESGSGNGVGITF
jgi:hypothetical protein